MNILKFYPRGNPQIIHKSPFKDDDLLDIPKYYPWMKKECISWWNSLINDQVISLIIKNKILIKNYKL
jgi:hypothetical protein